MSRYEGYDEYDARQAAMFQGALDSALYSPKGLRRLQEIERMLLAMPDKRLIANAIAIKPCGKYPTGAACFVGAMVAAKNPEHLDKYRVDLERAEAGYDPFGGEGTGEIGRVAGIPWSMGWQMGYENDESWGHLTDEQRWQAALDWTRRKIGEAMRRQAASGSDR